MTFLEKNKLAVWGEEIARDFLQKNGIEILASNYRTSSGEVDLIGKIGDRYLFVEVKTRQSDHFGFPEEAVTKSKLDRIEAVAWDYLEDQMVEDVDWQIDVIAILRNTITNRYEIRWIENVLE